VTTADIDQLRSLTQAAAVFKRKKATLLNWINRGVVVNGSRVKLQGCRVGGLWMVYVDAMDAFMRATNPDAVPVPESPTAQAKRFAADKQRALKLIRGN